MLLPKGTAISKFLFSFGYKFFYAFRISRERKTKVLVAAYIFSGIAVQLYLSRYKSSLDQDFVRCFLEDFLNNEEKIHIQ